jgi:hypothetical protein
MTSGIHGSSICFDFDYAAFQENVSRQTPNKNLAQKLLRNLQRLAQIEFTWKRDIVV